MKGRKRRMLRRWRGSTACFNEAGPVKGRKPKTRSRSSISRTGSFNEAGPVKGRKLTGSPGTWLLTFASMRPAL